MRQVFDNTRPTRICPWHFLTIIQRKAKQQNTKKSQPTKLSAISWRRLRFVLSERPKKPKKRKE